MKKIIIAIDGYSSCGKSTMAKDLAREIGYVYVDTGAMYRAVTLYALKNSMFNSEHEVLTDKLKEAMPNIHISFKLNSETRNPDTFLNLQCVEKEIRGMEVSENVSRVAAIGFVREFLVRQQQLMGKDKGIVMDGRDIATTVFPEAELKIFVTASAEIRAQRRFEELSSKGEKADYNAILENVKQRDYIDTHRAISPLKKDKDAILLDNSKMSIEEQKTFLLDLVQKTINTI